MKEKKSHMSEESEDIKFEDVVKEEKSQAEASNDTTEEPEILDDIEAADSELEDVKNLLNQREEELEKEKKEYMFLLAEFDNFKKRTLREKSEIIKNAAESVLKGLLPILDDFERGISASQTTSDAESIRQGMELIYNKFVKFLNSNGVTEIESDKQTFDADVHEAIAMVPTENEEEKGKVIDTIEKGYKLNDKVIRHAKVAVGQ